MKSYANKLGRISSEWKACALYGAEVSKASHLKKHVRFRYHNSDIFATHYHLVKKKLFPLSFPLLNDP